MAENLLAEPKKLNRIVIKEELVALTGDFKLAIVLNQMIYWSERRTDADQFIGEEIERIKRQNASPGDTDSIQPAHGWIYKKATARRHIYPSRMLVYILKAWDFFSVYHLSRKAVLSD